MQDTGNLSQKHEPNLFRAIGYLVRRNADIKQEHLTGGFKATSSMVCVWYHVSLRQS
jgi:hypothetical protein